MDAGVVQQPADVVVGLVVLDEVQDEVEHHLAADGLVSVHVGHVLHVRLAHHVLVGGPGKAGETTTLKLSSDYLDLNERLACITVFQ